MTSDSRATLVIENRLGELARVERWLSALLEQWRIAPDIGFRVDLLINEAVTNIVRYAYAGDTTQTLSLSLTDTADGILIEIVDAGLAFNPFDTPEMTAAQDLEQAAIGGHGIHLIKSFADNYDYDRVAGENRLRLFVGKDRDAPEPHNRDAAGANPSPRDISR